MKASTCSYTLYYENVQLEDTVAVHVMYLNAIWQSLCHSFINFDNYLTSCWQHSNPVGWDLHTKERECSLLLLGCKFLILVSLRLFWAKCHYIQPWRSRLGLHPKRYQKMYICQSFNMVSLRGQKSFDQAQIHLL